MIEWVWLSIVFAVLSNVIHCSPTKHVSYARGFGNHLPWQPLDQGLQAAKVSRKPILMVFHKSWCNPCKVLGPKVAASEQFEKLSKNFELINVHDDEEPLDENDTRYSPDGNYYPRILFASPDGVVDKEIRDPNANPKYKYSYSDPNNLIESMKKAMEAYPAKKTA